ncbi:MAG: diguanylate cyclase (GGDEF)-like protein [Phenylobacterium sp.]|jgi:diguanylate cyclase (GGDEF)-like protein
MTALFGEQNVMDFPPISSDNDDYARLCFFVEIAKTISRSKSIEETLDKVMEQIGSIFNPKHWSLLLKEPDSNDLKFVIAAGPNAEKLNNTVLTQGEGVAGWIVEHSTPVIIEDVSTDPRFSGRMDEYTGFVTKSIIGVPLHSGEQIFGVIELINKTNGEAFEPYELKILSSIADFAAIAIEKCYYCNALKKLASEDPLTGLYNRGSFENMLNCELENNRRYKTPLSLLMLDVDDFKHVNDTFGHPAGDDVLRMLASIMKAAVRIVDKPCRYGGDEFVIILPNTHGNESVQIRDRIQDMIVAQNRKKQIPEFHVSIGLHELCDDDNSSILALLDDDLYREKEKKEQFYIDNLGANLANMLDEERGNK